jgi:hypothetical protein
MFGKLIKRLAAKEIVEMIDEKIEHYRKIQETPYAGSFQGYSNKIIALDVLKEEIEERFKLPTSVIN